jgi:pimeloyl-ACP methyl ester carboxylesterase
VSFGGLVALEMAARYPGRLRALAVQGVGARPEPNLMSQVLGRVLNGYPLPTDDPFINQFFNLFLGSKDRPEETFRFVSRTCWQTDQAVMAQRFRLAEQSHLGPRLERVRVPTLVVGGDRDVLVSPANVTELCRSLPNARRASLTGAGHFAFVTHARTVAEQVRRFLD